MEQNYLMNTYRKKISIQKGKGSFLYDDNGDKYLDLIGGIATCSIGHGNEELSEVIRDSSLDIFTASNLFNTKPQQKLAEKLCQLSGMRKCFFSNSGSEAMECAIKLAKKHTGKHHFISMEKGFHGRTLGSLSATWKDEYKKPFYPLISGFDFVEYGNLEQLESVINENTAAIILEPIQGEAGVIVPPEGYLKEVYSLAKEKGILLIIDEIQTGNGRTGKYFCYQHEDFIPDIVTTAKGLANGLPIGATLTREGIDFEPGNHGSTFGGNDFCCKVALKTVEIIEKAMVNIESKSKYFIEKLSTIKNIRDIRGRGFILAIGVDDSKAVTEKCAENGLIVNSVNEKYLRVLPALTMSKDELDLAVQILAKVIDNPDG